MRRSCLLAVAIAALTAGVARATHASADARVERSEDCGGRLDGARGDAAGARRRDSQIDARRRRGRRDHPPRDQGRLHRRRAARARGCRDEGRAGRLARPAVPDDHRRQRRLAGGRAGDRRRARLSLAAERRVADARQADHRRRRRRGGRPGRTRGGRGNRHGAQGRGLLLLAKPRLVRRRRSRRVGAEDRPSGHGGVLPPSGRRRCDRRAERGAATRRARRQPRAARHAGRAALGRGGRDAVRWLAARAR